MTTQHNTSSPTSSLPWLGAGLSFRGKFRETLKDVPESLQPAVLEVFPDHFFTRPERLVELADRYEIVFHEIGLSPGTADTRQAMEWEEERLEQLERLMEHVQPLMLTEHLALTRSPEGVDIGHLAPLWYNEEQLEIVAEKVTHWQERLGVPIALENIAAPFVLPGSTWSEAEFLQRLVRETECGLLLDVTNHLYNARNYQWDLHASLQEYPLEAVRIVHMAGGFCENGWWVDSHSAPVEEDSIALLQQLWPRAHHSLVSVVVERDDALPEVQELCRETHRAARLWEQWNEFDCSR